MSVVAATQLAFDVTIAERGLRRPVHREPLRFRDDRVFLLVRAAGSDDFRRSMVSHYHGTCRQGLASR